MLSAWPSYGMDSGYTPVIRAPFQYSGLCGPGTLEISTLNAGGVILSAPGMVAIASGAMGSADSAVICSGDRPW